MPEGILATPKCVVNEISTKNSIATNILETLEVNDVLEIIKILLKYIRKNKFREPRPHPSYPCDQGFRHTRTGGWSSA